MADGETFNEMPVFDGGPNPASAMVLEEGMAYVLIQCLLSEHPHRPRSNSRAGMPSREKLRIG